MKKNMLSLMLFLGIQLAALGINQVTSALTSSDGISFGNFTGIDLRNSANVFITQGDATDIRVEADEEIKSTLIMETKNDILIIRSQKDSKNKIFKSKKTLNIYITVKDLKSVDLSGSGNITTKNLIKSENLTLEISGSGDINATVDAKELNLLLSGSGNIDVKGNTTTSNVKISGSGDVNGKELKCETSVITISGSGTSTIDVNNELTVSITGSGNVYYLNAPEKIHSKINGSGKIEKVKA